MHQKSIPSPADLPKSTESWIFGTTQLRSWISEAGQAPCRPFLLFIIDIRSGLILYSSIEKEVTVEKVQQVLFSSMLEPSPKLKVIPYRPDQVKFSDRKLMEALKPALEQVGVRAGYTNNNALINQFTRELEDHMREGNPEVPGLLEQRNVTVKMVADHLNYWRRTPGAVAWLEERISKASSG